MSLPGRAYAVGRRIYRSYRWFSSPERMRMRSTVRAWTRQQQPEVILELGGGTSVLRRVIERDVPGVRYISADIAPTDATDVVLDAARIPVRDGAVSNVLALEVLEHLSEPRQMLREVDRVLAPGGSLVLTVPFMFGVHDYRDYFRFTPLGLEALLAGSDLRLEATTRRGGTFVAATGLVKSMIRNKVLGDPRGWRAEGLEKKVRWAVVTVIEMPWVPIMWAAMALDRVFDRQSANPPGYFFRCVKTGADR